MARKNLLKGFKKPKGITSEQLELTKDYGKFTAFPFETGFGTTVGNTLRRVLLSSIQGYAITSVRITSYDADGVPHVISSEFETIPNVVEDTLEVLNSLKQIRLKLLGDVEQETFLFEFKGPGTVTSNDLTRDNSASSKLFWSLSESHANFSLGARPECGLPCPTTPLASSHNV